MSIITTKAHLGRETAHHFWDRENVPALHVEPGEEFSLELRDGSNGQITPTTTAGDLVSLDFQQMDPLTGPIWVEGARPGDALCVEILDISLAKWGWSAIIPGFGLLSDYFPDPVVRGWDLTSGFFELVNAARFELSPMLGVMGVAPKENGNYSSVVPTNAGGNIDVKYLQAGSRIYLPVFNDGALLSAGDAHALQGDGELSGTAIECEADVVIRVTLAPSMDLVAPFIDTIEVKDPLKTSYRTFLGVGPDLFEAARQASLRAVDGVAKALGVDASEAYILLGTIAELRIHEIVDRPNWVVGCMVPSSVFK